MTTPKGAIAALRLTLPGAPHTWHTVGDIGLFSPDLAVPLDTLGITEERAKQLDKDKGCPVSLEHISKEDAEAASDAYASASGAAVLGTRHALKRGIATEDERSRVSTQIDALKGTDSGANADPPKEG